MSEEYGYDDFLVGCALALKCLHIVDGPCKDKECTICAMLHRVDKYFGKNSPDKRIAELKAEIERLKDELALEKLDVNMCQEGLRRLEWEGEATKEFPNPSDICPACLGFRPRHQDDCWLKELLK